MSGWVKLERKIIHTTLWKEKPFSRAQALIDLKLLANHAPGYIRVAGERIDLTRGQLGWSILKLAERWGWSRKKTSGFIKELERDNEVTTKRHTKTTIITICNYCIFDVTGATEGTTEDTAEDTTKGTTEAHEQEEYKKNIRRIKKKEKEDKPLKFRGNTIRLNEADYEAWEKAYHAIPDLTSSLQALDDWLKGDPSKQKNWFVIISSALAKKHQEYLQKAQIVEATKNTRQAEGEANFKMMAEQFGG